MPDWQDRRGRDCKTIEVERFAWLLSAMVAWFFCLSTDCVLIENDQGKFLDNE